MDNLQKLIRERAQLRRVFLRHETAAASTSPTAVDIEFLEEKAKALEKLDKEIQSEMLNDCDDKSYDQECNEADDLRKRWLTLRSKFKNDNQNKKQESQTSHKLNLPKLEIRKFDDDPRNWLSFWGQYKKIHEDGSMDAETKFQYLTQAMTTGSKARSLVESYPPTEENYKKVIKMLKERFAKDETLIELYVRELLKLVACKNTTPVDILYDKITTNLQILESLGIVKDKYECILLPLIESALPESTLLLWSKTIYTVGDSKLVKLIEFLQTEVEAERRVQMAKSEFLGGPLTPATAACLVNESNKQVKEKTSTPQHGKELCFLCEKGHNTFECNKANTLSLDMKKEAIKKKGGCFVCLKRGHLAKNCKAFIKCMRCSKRHLLILCPDLHEQPKTCEASSVANHFSGNTATTLLQTLVIKISSGKDNQQKEVRALLDSGSQRTYIRTTLAEELGLKVTGRECLSHSLFGGVKKEMQTHQSFKFQVSNLDDTYITTMSGLGQDILCGDIPKVTDKYILSKLQKQKILLSDAFATNIKDISILIGSDQLGAILDNDVVRITDKLVAVRTKLGWTLQGPVQTGVFSNIVHTGFTTAIPEMDNSLEFLWNIETLGIRNHCNKETNETCLNISVNNDGRYEVSLLWKAGYPKIEPNYETARRRLQSMTQKLSNTARLEDYHNIFKEWKQEGIIELVETNDENDGHYLPHHAVIKMESATTKIRPVLDASSKDRNGLSLNMCIEKGANLIEIIPQLLMKFRTGMCGVISDIKKAFLQISISPEDRKYLKLLWWNDPNKKDEHLTYQHTRVPFGVACSPFLLAATINHHLEQHVDAYPETATRLKESFYVDNCVTSFGTKYEVMKFIQEATELMNKGKFELRGWMTNSIQEEEAVSVLGVQWDRKTDKLFCNLNLKAVPNNITKRDLLSVVQQIFDPIGFLSPVALIPKLIIQKAWLLRTGWDEKIPMELEKEYRDWIQTTDYLRECKIPRCLSEYPLQQCQTTIHVFCDSSKDAYSGCIFLRTEHQGQVTVRLILAKTRVSPIKRQQLTLPRLELMGALIATRLYREVITSGLLSACKTYKTHCWTDSSVVLAWIQRQDTWKTFVTNRVIEICTYTNKDDWKHLPGVYNIADLPSRGCNSKTLLETQWWMGPQWLYLEERNWPKSIVNYTEKEEEIISNEQNRNTTVNVEITTEVFSNRLLYFSQYNKIVRLVARLLRFSPRVRKMFDINSTNISFEEYKHAEECLIKLIQRESYTEKKKNKKLITTEEGGIIKVKTRLEYSGEEKDFIYPILLPGNNKIIMRMIQEVHKKMNHAGTQTLMTTLRNSYWITGVRKVVKNVVSECIICKRYKAKHYEVPEPPLPADRIKTTATFTVTGIDLAGPLYLKNSQRCWIVLYTCAVYRAIHLELTDSLSTSSFLMTFRRFIARRGKPMIVYTDNGTNLVGAANLLHEVNWQEIEEATSFYKIHWKFSVPAAPWWGGWWERLVRVVKDMLRRILGKASVDWIELSTILCDCETVINSRPLTYVQMGDVKPLTPMLFLQSLPTSETPELDQIDERNIQVRYRYLQQLREDFRKRFKSEYLSLLISKGKECRKEPKVGDLVLVEMEKSRLHWPVGLIKEIFTGKDGLTRAARVITAAGEKVRPYQRLYPLELSTVSQEWLERVPASKAADPPKQLTGIDETGTQSASVPVPLASTTRSGRTIKLPHRFME